MQPAVNEVGCQVHQQWPFHSVGTHQRHIVFAQQVDECAIAETVVTDFEGVAKLPVLVHCQPCRCLQSMVMPATEFGGRPRITRQQVQEFLDPFGVKAELRGELPKDRPELGAKPQQS
jgi:hypothetical protein